MFNPRIQKMRPYTADRKRELFSVLDRPVIADLTIGEPQHTPDPKVIEILNQYAAESVGRYPKTRQEQYLTEAIIKANLETKTLRGSIADNQVLAGLGSGELLFSMATASLDSQRPYVLIPNPAYQVYSSATEMCGGIPYFFDLKKENNFQPDLSAIPDEILRQTSLCYINSPNNPCAVSYAEESLRELLLLARRYGFVVASDECYSEIYFADKPVSMLEVCASIDGDNSFRNVAVFDTLSKRSSLPGLRSGSMVGDAQIVANYLKLRFSERKVLSNNVQRASAYAWTNFIDVARNRALYREKFNALREIFAKTGISLGASDSTFYAWIDISEIQPNDEVFALELAQATGILTFPGSYFSVSNNGLNPGAGFIRLALIDSVEATWSSLSTIAEFILSCKS